MDKTETLRLVEEIFRDILDDDEIALTLATTADDVEGWDSLTHIQLIVAIEKRFKIKFTAREIMSWQNVGEMIDGIEAKLCK
jgi:acyl carrier protein